MIDIAAGKTISAIGTSFDVKNSSKHLSLWLDFLYLSYCKASMIFTATVVFVQYLNNIGL